MSTEVKEKPESGSQPEPHNTDITNGLRDEASVSAMSQNPGVEYLKTPDQPYMDTNEYRVIRLPNGLTALLSSVPKNNEKKRFSLSETSGDEEDETSEILEEFRRIRFEGYPPDAVECSLCINVGKFSNPWRVPGIGEILCRLVPRHSKEFPSANDKFDSVVDWLKVCCEAETTTFSFGTVDNELPEALDRFTQCFISPLIREEDVTAVIREKLLYYKKSRERKSISNGDIPDRVKKEALLNHCSKDNPIKNLSEIYIARLQSIPVGKVYKELLKFRERHYSANRMHFYIQAKMSLDDLEELVIDYFSEIPNNGLQPDDFNQFNFMNSFNPVKFCQIYSMQANRSFVNYKRSHENAIQIMWTLPPSQWLYRYKSLDYISFILNYSGAGSLSSYLEKMNWCFKVSCEVPETDFHQNSIYTCLELTLHTTEEGFKNCNLVIGAVYSYIHLMQSAGPAKPIFNQLKAVSLTKFRFRDYYYPSSNNKDWNRVYIVLVNENMTRFLPEDYLGGHILFRQYDPVSIQTCTSLLTPERANIAFHERNYSGQPGCYTSRKVPNYWMKSWKNAKPLPEMELPAANIYCSSDLEPVTFSDSLQLYPVKIHADACSEIWYKSFGMPFCHMFFLYVTPLTSMSSENAVMLELFVSLLNHVMAYDIARANEALLNCRISEGGGLEVQIDGPSQNALLLMQKITTAMVSCCEQLTESLFGTLKQKILLKYEHVVASPKSLANDIKMVILIPGRWSTYDKHAAILNLKLCQFQEFLKQFANHVYVKGLVQGKIMRASVIENVQKFSETLKYGPPLTCIGQHSQCKKIPQGERCVRIESPFGKYSSTVVINYYQFPEQTFELSVILRLMKVILNEEEFKKLFEKYARFPHASSDILSYALKIETIDVTPAKIDAFLEKTRRAIDELVKKFTDQEWIGVKNHAGKIMFADCYYTIESMARINWREIVSGQYVFDRISRGAQFLSELKLEDFRKYLSILTSDGPEMRKLSVQVVRPEPNKTPAVKPGINNKRSYEPKYLENFPDEKDKKEDYFITDIYAYKRGLNLVGMKNTCGHEK